MCSDFGETPCQRYVLVTEGWISLDLMSSLLTEQANFVIWYFSTCKMSFKYVNGSPERSMHFMFDCSLSWEKCILCLFILFLYKWVINFFFCSRIIPNLTPCSHFTHYNGLDRCCIMYLCQNLHIERGVNFYKQTLAIFFQVLFLEKKYFGAAFKSFSQGYTLYFLEQMGKISNKNSWLKKCNHIWL